MVYMSQSILMPSKRYSTSLNEAMAQIKLDTTGLYLPTETEVDEVQTGRILLRDDQLVCAQSPTQKISVPINRLCDISVSGPPSNMKPYPDPVVSIAYNEDGTARAVTVAPETISAADLADTLIKEFLDDIPVFVALSGNGNSEVNQSKREGQLSIDHEGLRITTSNPSIIRLESIAEYQSVQYTTAGGAARPAIRIRYQTQSKSFTMRIVFENGQHRQILGRYLNRN